MRKDEIVRIYDYVINHLSIEEKKIVEEHERDTLYLTFKESGAVLEEAILRIIRTLHHHKSESK